jgi:hypothetical protein
MALSNLGSCKCGAPLAAVFRTLSGHRRRTDAAKLSELPLPTPRKIAYFYAHIASIQDDLARLATEPGPGRRTERIRRVLAEFDGALALGDDILRELRLLLSPKHQKSLTRA